MSIRPPVISSDCIVDFVEIDYLGECDFPNDKDFNINNGHCFKIRETGEEQGKEFCVIGWVERTEDCSYDFILKSVTQERFFLAVLKGRNDSWPLFAIQDGKVICSRTRMGSKWNCRLCAKYFDAVCRGR